MRRVLDAEHGHWAREPRNCFQERSREPGALASNAQISPYAADIRGVTDLPISSIKTFVCWFETSLQSTQLRPS